MKATPHLTLALLVASGLAMSIALLPREQELALIRLKDADLGGAQRLFESRLARGDRSPTTLTALSQLDIIEGRIEDAIALVKLYVADHPQSVEGWTTLAEDARQAQDYDLLIEALERLAKISPDRERERELERIYFERGDADHQAAVLKRIIERFGGETDDYVALARVEAASGNAAAALVTLARLEQRDPGRIDAEIIDLRLRLLADLGEGDVAVAEAARRATSRTALFLSQTLNRRLGPQQALAFLAPLAARPDAGEAIIFAADEYEAAGGNAGTVLARLDAGRRAAPLPPARAALFFRLALAAGQLDDAETAAEATGLAVLPADTIATLADAFWAAQRLDIVERLVAAAGPALLAERPLLGAQLAVASHDPDAATRWIAQAREAARGEPETILALVELEEQLGRDAAALADLDGLVRHNALPHEMAAETAELYVRLGRAADGAAALGALRQQDPAPEIAEAWAYAVVNSGDTDAVATWLAAQPKTAPSTSLLETILDRAAAGGAKSLALTAAQRLVDRSPTVAHREALARALLDHGDTVAALDQLRQLRATAGGETRYAEALTDAFDKGAPVRGELLAYWRARLSRPRLAAADRDAGIDALLHLRAYGEALPFLASLAERDPKAWLAPYVETALKAGRKGELVSLLKRVGERPTLPVAQKELFAYALLDQGGAAAALPILHQLATSRGGEWEDGYEVALTKLGRTKELRVALVARAARPGAPVEARRDIAHRLLDGGDKQDAEKLFRALATNAAPESADVSDLLYLWGPRPRAGELAWLEDRARRAAPGDKAKWLDILADRGARQAVVALYDPDRPGTDQAFETYLDALATNDDRKAAAASLQTLLANTTTRRRLQRIGEVAHDLHETELARRAFDAWAAAAPDQPEAQRALGLLSFEQHDYATAGRCLRFYLARNDTDWEADLTLGEVMTHAKDKGAPAEFAQALHLVETLKAPDFQAQSARAYLHFKTGDVAGATALYDHLLEQNPTNDDLRADYATMLLDVGDVDAARAVLRDKPTSGARRSSPWHSHSAPASSEQHS